MYTKRTINLEEASIIMFIWQKFRKINSTIMAVLITLNFQKKVSLCFLYKISAKIGNVS